MGRRTTAITAIVAALLASATLISAVVAKKPKVHVSNCGESVYRPHQLVVYCGDAGVVLTGIDWSHWGRRSANGDATAATKSCDPDCATGGVTHEAVTVRLSHRHYCKGAGEPDFLRLTVRYPAGNVLRTSLGCAT
jgi:hypothetical protein